MWVSGKSGQDQQGRLAIRHSIDLGFSERFQAKLCLGFGLLYFEKEFIESSYATYLRNYLWTKTSVEREKMPLRGKGILAQSNNSIISFAGHESLIIVFLMPHQVGVGLYLNLYGRQDLLALATDDLRHWPKSYSDDGIAFAIAPSIGKAIGPISTIQLIAGIGKQIPNTEINKLLDEIELAKKEHPKFDL